jgi:hypothetical protein
MNSGVALKKRFEVRERLLMGLNRRDLNATVMKICQRCVLFSQEWMAGYSTSWWMRNVFCIVPEILHPHIRHSTGSSKSTTKTDVSTAQLIE